MSKTTQSYLNLENESSSQTTPGFQSVLNDTNGWFETPRALIIAIERIVHVSVKSTKIIENLPAQLTDD